MWRGRWQKTSKNHSAKDFTPADLGWLEAASVLLVVQAGIGLLSAVVQIILAVVGLPQSPISLLVFVGVPVLTLTAARALLRRPAR